MGEVFKILEIILLSSVKFIAGPPFAYYNQKYDFGYFETITYSVIGGMLGVVVFTFLGDQIFIFWHWLKHHTKKTWWKRKQIFSEPKVDVEQNIEVHYSYIDKAQAFKKIFTPHNRRVVRIWQKFGIMGIAFFTPILLSIPLGTLIAVRLVHRKRKIFLYMFISILFWSVLMTSLFKAYDVVSLHALEREILK